MAEKSQFTLSVDSKQLEKELKRVNSRYTNRVVENSIKQGAKPIAQATKKNTPKETGLLRKSIGTKKIKFKKNHFAILVGSRANVTGIGPDGKTRRPVRYHHLVELGHTSDGAFVRGTHFTRRAFLSNREQSEKLIQQKLLENIQKFIHKS